MTGRRAARIAAAILCLVVLFQLALVLGAPWGEFTQGGANSGTLPTSGRLLAGLSSLLLLVMAAALLARADDGPFRGLPARLITVLAWCTTIYAGISVALNAITPSSRERMLWLPVTCVILLFAVVTMLKTRRDRMPR